jgi:hypothetical protein
MGTKCKRVVLIEQIRALRFVIYKITMDRTSTNVNQMEFDRYATQAEASERFDRLFIEVDPDSTSKTKVSFVLVVYFKRRLQKIISYTPFR